MSKHVVLTVFGSLGDLHPMIALALGLQARGHRVTIATNSFHREKIESEGIAYHRIRPEFPLDDPAFFANILHRASGPEALVRKHMLPGIGDMLDDLLPLLETADFLVNSTLVYAGPLAARKLELPWAAVVLAPMSFFSVHDPPIFPNLLASEQIHKLGPRVAKWMAAAAAKTARRGR